MTLPNLSCYRASRGFTSNGVEPGGSNVLDHFAQLSLGKLVLPPSDLPNQAGNSLRDVLSVSHGSRMSSYKPSHLYHGVYALASPAWTGLW